MENPRIVLAWFRHFLEEQDEILGADPWAYGLGDSNRKNLETLMQYSQEQGLLGRKMSLDRVIHQHDGTFVTVEGDNDVRERRSPGRRRAVARHHS